MLRLLNRTLAVVTATACLAFVTPTADAAASWERKTTGAAGWGTRAHSGQTYTLGYTLYDTKTDGHCAYVAFQPEVYWATKVTGWSSVGTWGYEKRHEVCGWGKHIKGTDRIDVWSHMSALDKRLGTAIRMRIKVCREVKGIGRDNCSEMTTPPVNV